MEDGDDDISLTADGQTWKDNQGSSENDIVLTKDEKGRTLGEQYLIPSTSPRQDNPYVASAKFDDKEDLSDQESENKTFSSDINPVDNSSEFLDENCDELHNTGRSEPSSICAPSEQPASTEENDKIVSQDDFSESYEDRSEQFCSGEGNTFSSLEEAKNAHSSVGEEEEAVEEEEEEDHQTSVSSDELAAKLPESYLQDENMEHSKHPNERDEDNKTSEHPNKNDDDNKTSEHQCEEYDEAHLKTPDHPDEEYDDEMLLKSSDSPDEYNDEHFKTFSDDNLKTSEHTNEEFSDENLQKYNLSNVNEDELLKSPDSSVAEYDDENFKKADSPTEHDENFKKYDSSIEQDDENFKKSDSSIEHDDENFKKSLASIELDDENFKKSDSSIELDDENFKKSDSSIEQDDENFKKYDSSIEQDDENFKKYDSSIEQDDENFKNSDSSIEHDHETCHPNEESDNNIKTSDHPHEEFSEDNIKKFDLSNEGEEVDKTSNYPCEEFGDETLRVSDSSYEENDSENHQKCEHPGGGNEEEDNNEQERSSNGLLSDTDLQLETYEDERDLDKETQKLSQIENVGDNCNVLGDSVFSEKCSQNNKQDDFILSDERNIDIVVSNDAAPHKMDVHDGISSRKEETDWEEFDETATTQGVSETEDLVSGSEHTDEQLHLDDDHCLVENEQQMCQENERNEHWEMEVEQQSSINNAQSVVSDEDAVEFLESEKMVTDQLDETGSKQEEKVVTCSFDKEEESSCDSALNSIEKSTEAKEVKCERTDEGETISGMSEQDIEMYEISPERSDTNSMSVCKKVLPSVQECSSLKQGDHDAVNDDSLCVNEANNFEKLDEAENIVRVNGEVELINSNLLNDKEASVSVKEKVGLKRKLQTSPNEEMPCDISPPESVRGNIQFKGFKKRYIAQVSEVSSKESPDVSSSVPEELRIKSKRASKKLVIETPQVIVSHQPLPDGAQANTPLTEYAQYLGLQPTVKFKCYNCGESGFPSMLKLQEHQNVCLKSIRIHTYTKPPPSPIVEPAPSTNFRITRKVYLCSACGTYYENWNLFLHMREVHKRHICLFCLLMFSQADKLAQHLSAKHGIADSSYSSPEQFLNEFKGSFFVMCCTCEQMFSERDNFFEHLCRDPSVISTDQACSLCGLKGAHFPTCRRAFTDNSSLASPSQNNSQNAAINTSTDTSQNSQLSIQEKPSSSKYSAQADKSTTGRKSLHKLSEQNHDRPDKSHNTGDLDDDYDISDAASYCHVNIHEPDKQKAASPNENIDNKDGANVDTIVDSDKMDDEDEDEDEEDDGDDDHGEENQNATSITEETAKEKWANKSKDDDKNKTDDLVLQNDTLMEVDRLSPQLSEENEDENKQMAVDEKADTPPHISSNTNDVKESDIHVEPQLINEFKSPKEGGESESESSASAADSHDSDGSSSSSEASSDENEPEDKETQKTIKSDESDMDKSDSDKMSIVVDEARSEDDGEKQEAPNDDLHSNVTENETNEVHEHDNDILEESDVQSVEKPANTIDFTEEPQDNIQIAGDDVPLLELTLEETLDALSIQTVVKECVKISCSTCVYCNHAKKIAVNGKQLVLHLLAEHRFEPVVCSDSGELTPVYGFVDNLKSKLSELQDMYFNTDTYDSADKSFTRPYDRTYECFHCHFITTLHKELYVHNRKMHQKTILLCIMCKSNFYSYSELLCHLCPGIYVPDSNILFRCCLCVVDGLPSAFRLMVHLRKRHHACDVCLETTGDQQKLSNHVWKHKLHHLCYRCGIAYRNKPDITKHLFWKHGTESVLCKKCLQKKWPHVYHFCIPPTAFLCEECNASFSRAVALKVHKRLHADDIPYQCDECEERFISKKLLRRHKEKHKQVTVGKEDYKNGDKVAEKEIDELEQDDLKSHGAVVENDVDKDLKEDNSECAAEKSTVTADTSGASEAPQQISKEPDENSNKFPEETKYDKKSKVVDVYDLPPLNLSSDSDDSDEEQTSKQPVKDTECEETVKMVLNENASETLKSQDGEPPTEEEVQPVQIVDGVWDNFKTYKANLEKREILQAQASGNLVASSSTSLVDNSIENHAIVDVVMADHDYCVLPEKPNEDKNTHLNVNSAQPLLNSAGEAAEAAENLEGDKGGGFGADHNYCFNTSPRSDEKKEQSVPLPQIPTVPPLQSPPLPVSHPSLPTPPPPTPPASSTSSPKKKQKSPKKKQKQSGSSSSSDSSSNSDSTSCTCGTNCSCSSSSSSSSGSSSSSSDSDSSSSEGRRRQAARRERRRERAKRKLETGSRGGTPPPTVGLSTSGEAGGGLAATLEATHTPAQFDSSGAGSLQVDDTPVMAAPECEENEFLIRESDLDTTETETDEDFYDKYPQRQANKLLAEKRNQLLLLAAVAPVNNGTIAQPSPPPPPEVQEPVQKKKGKTKRHKKAQHNSSEKKVENKLKLNIPVSYYNSPSFSVANAGRPVSPVTNSQNPTSSHISRLHHDTFSPANPEASSTPTAYHSTGSGSETESKRLSKRKRIPKKFYGDSSDEEAEHTPHLPYKWRKVTPASSSTPHVQPTISSGFGYRGVSVNVPPPEPVHVQPLPAPEKSEDEDGDESDSGHEAKRSSSDSSNSESDNEQSDVDSDVETVTTVTNAVSSVSGNATQQKNENLYCYCQCPYDEVSEMIACDGKDCSIEWFHFECVGIMVPPKGKWFCPDCRKKTAARGEYLLHA